MTLPLDVTGPAAPPRANGELVFAEPWQGRAFGMAVALCEAGAFAWPQFRSALVARIAARPDGPYEYYRLWLSALEDVLEVAGEDIDARARALAGRSRDHGHRH